MEGQNNEFFGQPGTGQMPTGMAQPAYQGQPGMAQQPAYQGQPAGSQGYAGQQAQANPAQQQAFQRQQGQPQSWQADASYGQQTAGNHAQGRGVDVGARLQEGLGAVGDMAKGIGKKIGEGVKVGGLDTGDFTNFSNGSFDADSRGALGFKVALYVAVGGGMMMFGSYTLLLQLFLFAAVVEKNRMLNRMLATMALTVMALSLAENCWSLVCYPVESGLSTLLQSLKYDSGGFKTVTWMISAINWVTSVLGYAVSVLKVVLGFKWFMAAKTGKFKVSRIVSRLID